MSLPENELPPWCDDENVLKENCYEQYKRIEKLETSFGKLIKAWEFWQSQETKNGFSELCAAYWDAKAVLEKKDDAR